MEEKVDFIDLDEQVKKLFPLPEVIAKILEAVNDPKTSASSIERILKVEASFTLKILALANSAYYGAAREITNIRNAITLLGINMIKNLAMQVSLNGHFTFDSPFEGFSGKTLWKHSLGVGVCAKLLCRRLVLGNAEDYFTLGILHDMGLIIEHQFYSETLYRILDQLYNSGGSLTELEQQAFGLHHGDLARKLSTQWRLPEGMGVVIQHHHDPLQAPFEFRRTACAINLADLICKRSRFGFHYPESHEIPSAILEILGLEDVDTDVIEEDFLQQAEETVEMFQG